MSLREYGYRVITGQRFGFVAFCVRALLRFFSWFYQALVFLAVSFYRCPFARVHNLGRPVISVGNITWGGVGKTPLVAWLTGYLKARGYQPAVLSRGYGPSVDRGTASSDNDEVRMLKTQFPGVTVIAGKDRVRSAQAALTAGRVDVFILDDGFQQWRVRRDVDVVLIDATCPFGNGFFIPRGPLREPRRALKRADIVVLTKTGAAAESLAPLRQELQRINPRAVLVETDHCPLSLESLFDRRPQELSGLKGRAVCLVSSIGDPGSFERLVSRLAADVRQRFFFPDHHRFTETDIQNIVRSCRDQAITRVVVTAKDAVKIEAMGRGRLGPIEVSILNINIEFLKGRDEFFARIDPILRH